MINKFKNWLGIEGVKARLDLKEPLRQEDYCIEGNIELHSIRAQTIEDIHIRLIEKYKRGKKESLKIDEFILGGKILELNFKLEDGESRQFPFRLEYEVLQSSMDKLGKKNFIVGGLVSLLKREQNVSSTFRLEVKINCTGSALPPKFDFPINFNKKRQA